MNSLVDRFAGELPEGGNLVCCLIIVVIFMRFGGTYRVGGDFKVIIWGASHKGLWSFFIGGVDPLRH